MLKYEYQKPTGTIRKSKTRIGIFECDICGHEFERPMKIRRSERDSCSKKCMNKGRVHTLEHNHKIALSNTGIKNHFFGKHHDDETRQRISRCASEAWKHDDYRAKQIKRLSQQIGVRNPFFGKHHDEETCRRMSETRSKKIASGELRSGPRGRQGTYVSIKTQQVERYDSFFELLRMRMLDENVEVVSWTKKHNIQIPYVIDDKRRLYVPDFYVKLSDNSTRLEEIKGYEEEQKRVAKFNALITYCAEHGYDVLYIDFEMLECLTMDLFGTSIAVLRKKEFQK